MTAGTFEGSAARWGAVVPLRPVDPRRNGGTEQVGQPVPHASSCISSGEPNNDREELRGEIEMRAPAQRESGVFASPTIDPEALASMRLELVS